MTSSWVGASVRGRMGGVWSATGGPGSVPCANHPDLVRGLLVAALIPMAICRCARPEIELSCAACWCTSWRMVAHDEGKQPADAALRSPDSARTSSSGAGRPRRRYLWCAFFGAFFLMIFQLALAALASTLPAASVALTSKLCLPFFSFAVVSGELQGLKPLPSS